MLVTGCVTSSQNCVIGSSTKVKNTVSVFLEPRELAWSIVIFVAWYKIISVFFFVVVVIIGEIAAPGPKCTCRV